MTTMDRAQKYLESLKRDGFFGTVVYSEFRAMCSEAIVSDDWTKVDEYLKAREL